MNSYKIRNKETGLFSTGSGHIRFNKNGRLWSKKCHLSSHMNHADKTVYANCEVVQFELIEVDVWPISEEFELVEYRAEKREMEYQQRRIGWQEEKLARMERELAELKKEML